jgi:hypothetical protein
MDNAGIAVAVVPQQALGMLGKHENSVCAVASTRFPASSEQGGQFAWCVIGNAMHGALQSSLGSCAQELVAIEVAQPRLGVLSTWPPCTCARRHACGEVGVRAWNGRSHAGVQPETQLCFSLRTCNKACSCRPSLGPACLAGGTDEPDVWPPGSRHRIPPAAAGATLPAAAAAAVANACGRGPAGTCARV